VDTVRILRYVSIAEATSFLLLLLVAMPLKYGADTPQGVQVMGPIHGVLFLAYVGLVLIVRGQLGWDAMRTVLALIAAVLPVAPYFVERYWLKPQRRPEVVRA
jgi:integral membrane protein